MCVCYLIWAYIYIYIIYIYYLCIVVNPDGANIPVEDFTQEDRERVLELLLSQERVVTLLYAKSFPVAGNNVANKTGLPLGGMEADNMSKGALGEDYMSNSQSNNVLPAIRAPSGGNDGGTPATGGAGGAASWESFFN